MEFLNLSIISRWFFCISWRAVQLENILRSCERLFPQNALRRSFVQQQKTLIAKGLQARIARTGCAVRMASQNRSLELHRRKWSGTGRLDKELAFDFPIIRPRAGSNSPYWQFLYRDFARRRFFC